MEDTKKNNQESENIFSDYITSLKFFTALNSTKSSLILKSKLDELQNISKLFNDNPPLHIKEQISYCEQLLKEEL